MSNKIATAAVVSAAGLLAVNAAAYAIEGESTLLRPPGAVSEHDFMARCVKCGKCIEACPYKSLIVAPVTAGNAAGTPTLNTREQACRLCQDFPCVHVCPTQALRDVVERSDVHMGIAVIDEDICIAFQGMRCEVCYRACPLIDEAITIDYRLREGDAIHSVFAPIINEDKCVGCGLCVERCVVSDPVVPIKIITTQEQLLTQSE